MAITKIGSRGIADGAVAAADFAPGTITEAKLAGSISNSKLANSTITVGGTSTALGATSTPSLTDWQSVVTGDTTMVSGRGYFVNTTSGAVTMTLPSSANAGDFVSLKDYAETWDSNNCTVARNGHKLNSYEIDTVLTGERQSVTFVYIDTTRGWLITQESTVGDLGKYIAATGGTVTTSGNDKIHTFTGDGNFVVSQVGSSGIGNSVSYLVLAGGGGGGSDSGTGGGVGSAGGGAGGFREGKSPHTPYTSSPIVAPDGLTISAQTYPITVGGGGASGGTQGNGSKGSNSVFSTITSAGGGQGLGNPNTPTDDGPGGSGGGGTFNEGGGSGNTPPVSPSQGNNGESGSFSGQYPGGGGGGAAEAGGTDGDSQGGDGVTSSIPGSSTALAGGGGGSRLSGTAGGGGDGGGGAGGPVPGGNGTAGTTNKGGGGGGSAGHGGNGAAGGSGVVIIRYKYQN